MTRAQSFYLSNGPKLPRNQIFFLKTLIYYKYNQYIHATIDHYILSTGEHLNIKLAF